MTVLGVNKTNMIYRIGVKDELGKYKVLLVQAESIAEALDKVKAFDSTSVVDSIIAEASGVQLIA